MITAFPPNDDAEAARVMMKNWLERASQLLKYIADNSGPMSQNDVYGPMLQDFVNRTEPYWAVIVDQSKLVALEAQTGPGATITTPEDGNTPPEPPAAPAAPAAAPVAAEKVIESRNETQAHAPHRRLAGN